MTSTRHTFRGTITRTLALFAALLFVTGAASAQDDAVAVREVETWEWQSAPTLWTRDELESAVPRAFPMPSDELRLQDDGLPDAIGEETVKPGGLGDPDALEAAQALHPEAWASLSADGASKMIGAGICQPGRTYSSTPPYTRFCTNFYDEMWKTYPWRTMGRLFFRIPGEGGFASCSASVGIGRAVWTAGHCVFTPGRGWHMDMVFIPAYRAGIQPFGLFPVYRMATLNGWINGGNNAFDVGMVAVLDQGGRRVADWVGYLGAWFNTLAKQQFHSHGYPANITGGRYLITCAATTSGRDGLPGPDPVCKGCDMTFGASGGPWLIDFAPYEAGMVNFVNGVVSYGTPGTNRYYSPYFGNGPLNLYQWGAQQ